MTTKQWTLYQLARDGATAADLRAAAAAIDKKDDTERQRDLAQAIEQTAEKFREQAATIGMTARQAEIYKLAMDGASQADIEKLKREDELATAAEEAARKHRDLEAAAARVFEATRTPMEKYRAELEQLNQMLAQNLIDQETYARQVSKLQEDIAGADRSTRSASGPRFTAALEQGTVAAHSAATQGRFGTAQKTLEQVNREQLKELKKIEQHVREARTAATQQPQAQILESL